MRTVCELRALLLAGEFKPGERLLEQVLVQRLGVSRSPLRLALSMLQYEGLIELLPSGGYIVRAFNCAMVEDALMVRGVLEGTANRLAAERIARAPEKVTALRRYADAMEQALAQGRTAESIARYFENDRRFHRTILQMADSASITRLLREAMTLPMSASERAQIPSLTLSLSFLNIMQSHHRGLIDAIEHGEGARAESLGREHWRMVSGDVLTAMRSRQAKLAATPAAGAGNGNGSEHQRANTVVLASGVGGQASS